MKDGEAARLAASATDDQEPIAGESRPQHVSQNGGATIAAAPLIIRRRLRPDLQAYYRGLPSQLLRRFGLPVAQTKLESRR